MLDLLSQAARDGAIDLTALHVHHGLSPNADAWTAACIAFCRDRSIPIDVERVSVDLAGVGLESAARDARYAAYARRREDAVALAHHREDQAETVLLQLLRGTGVKGARGMPEWRALRPGGPHLFRPLLEVPRDEILAYARERSLTWVEDESNARSDADRNFLRNDVAPLLDARFPGWRTAVGRFARHAASTHDLVERLAHEAPLAPAEDAALAALRVRQFLASAGLRMPSEARLAEMARQLYGARPDAQVLLIHEAHEIRRYRGQLHAQPIARGEVAWRVPWAGEMALALGPDRGEVRFERATGEGLAATAVAQAGWYFAPRAGGERLRPRAQGPSRTLKNLLQEQGVPPWQRSRLPLLFHRGRLAWAPGIGIDAEYACAPGAEGLRPCWQVAGKAPLC